MPHFDANTPAIMLQMVEDDGQIYNEAFRLTVRSCYVLLLLLLLPVALERCLLHTGTCCLALALTSAPTVSTVRTTVQPTTYPLTYSLPTVSTVRTAAHTTNYLPTDLPHAVYALQLNLTHGGWRPITATPAINSCYPRLQYGTAHLPPIISVNFGYLAISGGLELSFIGSIVIPTVSSSTCLLDLTSLRWLPPPEHSSGTAVPVPRYSHACTELLVAQTMHIMVCGGGLNQQGQALSDMWVFSHSAGLYSGITHMGR